MTDGRFQAIHYVSDHAISMIYPLWRDGKDTSAIAKAMGLPEFEIANRLPLVLEQRREGEEMARRGQVWTDVMDAELRQYHAGQFSCAQIAVKMERGLTRNAVIGRAHRLGLSGNVYVRRPKQPRPRPVNKPIMRIVPANGNSGQLRVYESVETELTALRCVEVVPRNLSLVDLGTDECRYPYGDGPFVFCGHPKDGVSSYCQSHALLSKANVRMKMTQAQLLQSRRNYMANYRASKRAAMEAAE